MSAVDELDVALRVVFDLALCFEPSARWLFLVQSVRFRGYKGGKS